MTGLSKPTVKEVVDDLLRDRFIMESPVADDGDLPRTGRIGRRPRPLAFRADLGYVLGLDVGADKILAVVADASGAVVATSRRKSAPQIHAGPRAMLTAVRTTAHDALAAGGIDPARLTAVGVGTPGVVDPASGRISLAPQIVGWDGLALGHEIERWFPCPVYVDGETHLSLLAERRIGVARNIDDAVYVHIGVGISCGILVGGAIYRGANGAAGEIGYLTVVAHAARPADGSGPFEFAAGGGAFARRGQQAAAGAAGAVLRDLAGGDPAAVDAVVVFAAAQRHDAAALEIVEDLTALLARGIASVVTTLNPATVVIGGGLSRAGAALLAPLAARVQALVPMPPRFVLSSLGDQAVALGAVQLALQALDEQLFGLTNAPV